MSWFLLFADARAAREDPLRSPEVIWGLGLLVLALLVGAVVISAVDRWRKRAAAGSTDTDATNALSSYRAMYENGEITEEEYAKLRDRVAERVKKQLLPPAPDAPTTGESGGTTGTTGTAPPSSSSPPPPPPTTSSGGFTGSSV